MSTQRNCDFHSHALEFAAGQVAFAQIVKGIQDRMSVDLGMIFSCKPPVADLFEYRLFSENYRLSYEFDPFSQHTHRLKLSMIDDNGQAVVIKRYFLPVYFNERSRGNDIRFSYVEESTIARLGRWWYSEHADRLLYAIHAIAAESPDGELFNELGS